MKSKEADRILRKLEQEAHILGEAHSQFNQSKYIGLDENGKPVSRPRWRIEPKWIEFECGCRGERCLKVINAKPFDPIIFAGLPEQAVYDFVCWKHEPHMNKRVRLGNFLTFKDWYSRRRPLLMGKK
jgi:hypothetical protein